jgi:hypothetical protein
MAVIYNFSNKLVPFTVVFYNVSNKLDFDRGPDVMTTFAVVIYNVFNKLDFFTIGPMI